MTDPQDPLPEGQWLFRRLFTWALTVALLALLAVIVLRIPPEQLQLIAIWIIGLLALVVTYYLLAPSAPQLAGILARLPVGARFNPPRDPQ